MSRCTLLVLALGASSGLLAATPGLVEAQNDIVRMHDGSFVRGTVIERVEGSHIVLQTPTGEVRTIQLSEVASVGLGETDAGGGSVSGPGAHYRPTLPSAMTAPPTPAGEVSVFVTARAPGLTLHRYAGTHLAPRLVGSEVRFWGVRTFEEVCAAPCTASLPVGVEVLGVSASPASAPISVGPLRFSGNARLELDYESRDSIRVAGGLVLAATSGGLATLLAGIFISVARALDVGLIATGSIATGLGLAVSLPMILLGDAAYVRPLD